MEVPIPSRRSCVRALACAAVLVKTSKKSSFRVSIPVHGLRAGRHTISVRATDRGRRNRLIKRSFSRCRAPVVAPRFTG
jgi:hypothetical protein